MAVVGVENVSTVGSSILMESRLPSSSSSGQNSNQGRRSSRPSFYLQIEGNRTRERIQDRIQNLNSSLTHNQEDQNSPELDGSMEKENTNENISEDVMAFQTEHEDHCSMTSEQSLDLGEAEREQGVRKIIRQWSNTELNGPSKNSSPRTQLLGETEIERVRVARESIQMACERRDVSSGHLEEQVAEVGSLIEPVPEGLGLDNNVAHQTRKKREIRIVCGRQALVDLLNQNKQERERELQSLQGSCPVRNFAFRNRIQSVFRIRLMQNRGSTERNRSTTAAESELGFLRQRQTVSGLREEFLSRLQNNVHVQENDHSGILHSSDNTVSRVNETQSNPGEFLSRLQYVQENDHSGLSPSSDSTVPIVNETQGNSSVVAADHEHDKFDLASKNSRSGPSSISTENVCSSEVNLQGFDNQIEASRVHNVSGDGEESVNDEVTRNTGPRDNDSELFGSRDSEQDGFDETNQAHSDVGNEELQVHDSLSNPEAFVFVGIDSPEYISLHQPVIFHNASRMENADHVQDEELHEHNTSSIDLEEPGSEDAHVWDSSTQGDDEITEDEAQEWIGVSSFSEWRDGSQLELDQEQWHDGHSDDPSLDNTREHESREQSQQQHVESFWHESGSQQTLEHWSPLALETGASSTERRDIYYHSDDDNAHNIELRELSSRRRVSSLLSSGFRESLDQLIQSYVDRQIHTPDDWEPHEMSPPPFVGDDQDHANTNHNDDSSDIDEQTDILGSTSAAPSNRTWEQQFHDIPWSRDMDQHPGTVLEMINDLRIEMARLEQRMNHMQGMLEACVDVQLELQRAVRQEVSAALNRSVNPSESDEALNTISGSKWDWVRKGICCICWESKIDSLLYRCGHMCACAKCAGTLVEGRGKCPMCLAPIVEVIRAYTLH